MQCEFGTKMLVNCHIEQLLNERCLDRLSMSGSDAGLCRYSWSVRSVRPRLRVGVQRFDDATFLHEWRTS